MDQINIIKIISALLYPVGLVSVLFILGWLFRAKGWRILAGFLALSALTVFLLVSSPIVANKLVRSLEQQYPQRELADIEPMDAIIVLGGGLRIPTAPAMHTQIGHASDRYWYATRLFREGKGARIVLTGGNLYKQPGMQGEAYYASQLLQEWGVPSEAIIIEDKSRTTQQNLRGVAALLEQEKIESALLVTSAVHMPRSYELFSSLPITLAPASADVLMRDQAAPAIFDWIPSAKSIHLSTIAIHEYYGRWFYQISK